MSALSWPAPAKINLFLHVTGRRDDGYHLLQTAFQFLDICDQLDFSLRADNKISRRANYNMVTDEDDLVVQAAKLLREYANKDFGVDIHIDKRLPMGGGLGGGSSNAATTLVAMNKLVGLNLRTDELADLGLKLGADVPVFVRGHAAWAEGIGEILEEITPAEDWYVLVVPDCEVSTTEIFAAADLTRNTPAITIRDFLAGAGHNDCEQVVRVRYPEVARVLDWLSLRHVPRMTGTGACVFANFVTRARADELVASLPKAWKSFVTKGLNRSPLMERLKLE